MSPQAVSQEDLARIDALNAVRTQISEELEQHALGNRSWIDQVGQGHAERYDLASIELLEKRYELAYYAIERIKAGL